MMVSDAAQPRDTLSLWKICFVIFLMARGLCVLCVLREINSEVFIYFWEDMLFDCLLFSHHLFNDAHAYVCEPQ